MHFRKSSHTRTEFFDGKQEAVQKALRLNAFLEDVPYARYNRRKIRKQK